MAQSPNLGQDGPVRLTLISNGSAVADTIGIHDIEVRRAIGAIASAHIVVDDGDVTTGAWAITDGQAFARGPISSSRPAMATMKT